MGETKPAKAPLMPMPLAGKHFDQITLDVLVISLKPGGVSIHLGHY